MRSCPTWLSVAIWPILVDIDLRLVAFLLLFSPWTHQPCPVPNDDHQNLWLKLWDLEKPICGRNLVFRTLSCSQHGPISCLKLLLVWDSPLTTDKWMISRVILFRELTYFWRASFIISEEGFESSGLASLTLAEDSVESLGSSKSGRLISGFFKHESNIFLQSISSE